MTNSVVKNITVKDASSLMAQSNSIAFIDVREEDEVASISTKTAKNFPMSQINPMTFASDSGIPKTQSLFILCKSGGRSLRVANALIEAGYLDVTNVDGGIIAWEREGFPVIKNY